MEAGKAEKKASRSLVGIVGNLWESERSPAPDSKPSTFECRLVIPRLPLSMAGKGFVPMYFDIIPKGDE